MRQNQNNIKAPWTLAIFIALAVIIAYLFISTRTTLWDRDEPRFARAVVEMMESGNYLVPSFNGQLWADKPILFYWLMSVPIRIFGPTEFACRFFAAIGSAFTCLLTFFIGRRLLGDKAGLWAMGILATSILIIAMGTFATIDAVLLPFLVAVMAVFILTFNSKPGLSHLILISLALGAAILAKGPIGLFSVPAILALLFLTRKDNPHILRSLVLVAVALFLAGLIVLAWAIPANNATNGEFFCVFIGRHVLTRAVKPMEHHGGHFLLYLPYYLPIVIFGFLPWTLHLPGALSAILGGRLGDKFFRSLFFAWVVPIFVIMSLAATKLPHYILFIWPALALAVAATIIAAEQNTLDQRDRKWLRGGVWFFGPLVITIALGFIIGPWFIPITNLKFASGASGLILLTMSIIAIYCHLRNQPTKSAKVLLIGIIAFLIPFSAGVLPAIERMKIPPALSQAVIDNTSKDVPVATYKFGEPSLNFYIGRKIESLKEEAAVADWVRQPQQGVLIIPKEKFLSVQQNYGSLPLDQIASVKGLNYSKGKIIEVLVLSRKPDKL